MGMKLRGSVGGNRAAGAPHGAVVKALLAAALLTCWPADVRATWTSTFADGGSFEGDKAGDTAGPFVDSATGITATLATTALTAGLVLNEQGLLLGSGLDAAGGDDFGANEFWSISFNTQSQFAFLDLSGYGVDNSFSVQSPAFVGATITPGSSAVTFTPATGTFTFLASVAGDTFTTANLYGTSTIPTIVAGTNITYAVSASGAASIGTIGYNFVPEPTCLASFPLAGLMLLRRNRRAG